MRVFDHAGIPTASRQAGEMYAEATKVWVTDAVRHPARIGYLRFESDSPVQGPLRSLPQVALRVPKPEQEPEGAEILPDPFDATDTLRVVFVLENGAACPNIPAVFFASRSVDSSIPTPASYPACLFRLPRVGFSNEPFKVRSIRPQNLPSGAATNFVIVSPWSVAARAPDRDRSESESVPYMPCGVYTPDVLFENPERPAGRLDWGPSRPPHQIAAHS